MKLACHAGYAGYYSESLMDKFGAEAEGRIQEFSQQNLANMAWAFGKITHYMPSLLDAIAQKATAIVKVAAAACQNTA